MSFVIDVSIVRPEQIGVLLGEQGSRHTMAYSVRETHLIFCLILGNWILLGILAGQLADGFASSNNFQFIFVLSHQSRVWHRLGDATEAIA